MKHIARAAFKTIMGQHSSEAKNIEKCLNLFLLEIL
jgi:hypothetical protein